MPALDQVAELLVEERQQQALNMQTINIRVGGDDHAVELETSDVEGVARAGSQHVDDGTDLLVFDDALQIGLCHVERLALELEHRLEIGETPLTGAATGGVSFHNEQFSARGIVRIAAQEFLR